MPYSIGEFARLCGINATTLRAWQRRYGLLKPLRTDGGHRLYSDDDVQQALKVLSVPPAALAPEIFPQRNWLLVTSGKLSAARQRQIELWQQQVVSLEVIPL